MSSNKSSWTYLDAPLEKNYLWSLAVTLIPVIASFAVSWIIARWAGPRVMGAVSWAMAYATAALIFGKFGMGLAASRLASEYGVKNPGQLRDLFRMGLFYRFVFTSIAAVLVYVSAGRAAVFFNDPALERPIRVASLIIVCASFYEFMEHFIVGLNRFTTVYKVRSVNLFLRACSTAMLVLGGWGAVEILSGYCGAWLVAIFVYLVLLLKFLPPSTSRPGDRRTTAKRLLFLGAPLAVSSASVTIFSQMDRLMIGFFYDMEEVGQYAIARNVTEVSLFPAFALVMTLRPALASRFSSGEVEECSKILRQTLLLAMVFGILFASIFAVYAVPLFTLVYSREFLYAGGLMAVFLWVIALRSIGSVMLPALIAAERTRFYAYLTALSAVVNFFLNLLLIPAFRSKGAVIATILSYALLLVMGLRQISKIFKVHFGINEVSLVVRTFFAGALAGGLFWLFFRCFEDAQAGLSTPIVFLWVILQAVIYVLLISLFRVVRASQIMQIASKFRKTNC